MSSGELNSIRDDMEYRVMDLYESSRENFILQPSKTNKIKLLNNYKRMNRTRMGFHHLCIINKSLYGGPLAFDLLIDKLKELHILGAS